MTVILGVAIWVVIFGIPWLAGVIFSVLTVLGTGVLIVVLTCIACAAFFPDK